MEGKSQNFRLYKRSNLRKAEKLFYVHVPQIKDDTVEVEDENSALNFGSVRCVCHTHGIVALLSCITG